MTDGWGISCELVLRWMSLDLTDDKSTLVQVKAWCRQATSHYLSQCWTRSLSPNGITRPQWDNPVCAESFLREKIYIFSNSLTLKCWSCLWQNFDQICTPPPPPPPNLTLTSEIRAVCCDWEHFLKLWPCNNSSTALSYASLVKSTRKSRTRPHVIYDSWV